MLSKFSRKLGKNLGNFRNMHFRGFGEASEIIKKLVEKSMETCKIVTVLMNYERIFI